MEESTAAEDAADDGTVPADDFSDPSGGGMVPAPSALLDLSGLHAKTVVADGEDGRSVVVTGSANLTAQAWGGNVEFDAVLTGPTRACGVDAVLDGPGAGTAHADGALLPGAERDRGPVAGHRLCAGDAAPRPRTVRPAAAAGPHPHRRGRGHRATHPGDAGAPAGGDEHLAAHRTAPP